MSVRIPIPGEVWKDGADSGALIIETGQERVRFRSFTRRGTGLNHIVKSWSLNAFLRFFTPVTAERKCSQCGEVAQAGREGDICCKCQGIIYQKEDRDDQV